VCTRTINSTGVNTEMLWNHGSVRIANTYQDRCLSRAGVKDPIDVQINSPFPPWPLKEQNYTIFSGLGPAQIGTTDISEALLDM
jgi:hypothetical protein